MTHRSLDICQQPTVMRRRLCNKILRQYGFDMNFHEQNTDYQCYKRPVHLRAREIENLQPMKFSMWHCPQSTSMVHYNFFIAKCHLRNSALVFQTAGIHPDADIYPDSVVTEIDRDVLSMTQELYL